MLPDRCGSATSALGLDGACKRRQGMVSRGVFALLNTISAIFLSPASVPGMMVDVRTEPIIIDHTCTRL